MSRLAKILEEQLAEAKKKAGTKIRRKLGKGLGIEILCISSDVQLTITRDDKFPAQQEWETVIKYFPYPIPSSTQPTTRQEGSRYLLTARFASQRVSQLKFA